MTIDTLLEVLDAAHLSAFVHSPFSVRGGIMIFGPPGVIKTTSIELALNEYPNALIVSDINVQTLNQLRSDLSSGRYRTLGLPAFEKIYQRHSSTASNIEGHICSLVEEGFLLASYEDSRMATQRARAFVCGAMTYDFYAKHFKDWVQSGFARRFLWLNVNLKDRERLHKAVHDWKLIPFGSIVRRAPANNHIEYNINESESRMLHVMCKDQVGDVTPYILLKKIFCVLKWKYDANKKMVKRPMQIMQDLKPALTKQGVELELP